MSDVLKQNLQAVALRRHMGRYFGGMAGVWRGRASGEEAGVRNSWVGGGLFSSLGRRDQSRWEYLVEMGSVGGEQTWTGRFFKLPLLVCVCKNKSHPQRLWSVKLVWRAQATLPLQWNLATEGFLLCCLHPTPPQLYNPESRGLVLAAGPVRCYFRIFSSFFPGEAWEGWKDVVGRTDGDAGLKLVNVPTFSLLSWTEKAQAQRVSLYHGTQVLAMKPSYTTAGVASCPKVPLLMHLPILSLFHGSLYC